MLVGEIAHFMVNTALSGILKDESVQHYHFCQDEEGTKKYLILHFLYFFVNFYSFFLSFFHEKLKGRSNPVESVEGMTAAAYPLTAR